MTNAQASEITALIKAATGGRADESSIHFFEAALASLNYDSALQAATIGTTTWRFFPSWSEFKEVYRTQERLKEPTGEQRLDDGGKRGDHSPEWVWVWSWCRHVREPRNLIPFPQQHGHVDPTEVMTMDEYEVLRDEWLAAGSPKSEHPIPLAR